LIEGCVILSYRRWRGRASRALLLTSLGANLITQAFLWLVLSVFWRHYLVALLLSEVLIWAAESLMLWGVKANQLCLGEAARLSLLMNATSFGLGWFLPV
jgi:hypothetical protein